MHVTTTGAGPRVVLVHGGIFNGATTWEAQLPLADQYTLVIPDRPGYPPNAPIDREDFEKDAPLIADLIEEGTHLVGFSYGGVISLLAAALCSTKLRSLTIIEPPALGIARGRDDVDGLISRMETPWASGPKTSREFLIDFERLLFGFGEKYPDPLPDDMEQGVRILMGARQPWDADLPLEDLRATPFPKLAISGGYSSAFEAVCDVLESRLAATRVVISGNGHGIPELGATLNTRLREFFSGAERSQPVS